MNLYVESNFVLELALLQEQSESCRKILGLAKSEHIRLVIPAYSLIEPYEVQQRREKNRKRFSKELSDELNQLSRSQDYKNQKEIFDKVINLLVTSREKEKDKLDEVITKLTEIGKTIDLSKKIIDRGVSIQKNFDLSPQDSIVYASVQHHLKKSGKERSCFISKNSKDFNDPDIIEELDQWNCKVLFSFEDGMGYISGVISS